MAELLVCSTSRKDEGISIALFASFICVRPLHKSELILLNTELFTDALFLCFIILYRKYLDTNV